MLITITVTLYKTESFALLSQPLSQSSIITPLPPLHSLHGRCRVHLGSALGQALCWVRGPAPRAPRPEPAGALRRHSARPSSGHPCNLDPSFLGLSSSRAVLGGERSSAAPGDVVRSSVDPARKGLIPAPACGPRWVEGGKSCAGRAWVPADPSHPPHRPRPPVAGASAPASSTDASKGRCSSEEMLLR